MNRKLFNQALDQFKHFKYHFVMIQGTEYEKLDALKTLHNNDVEFDLTRFYKAIANLNTYTTVLPIMETETKAFNMMLEQAKYCFDKRPLIKTLPRKTENSAYNYLYGIKGVGEVTCNDITRKCHVETLDDLFNLTEDMLIEINGINKAKAKLVLNAISNDWESKKEYNISIRFDDGLEYKQEA
jgi:ERCC4-type nuclease